MTVLAEEMVRKMVPVLRKTGVSRAYLFGSMATGAADERSDIDLLIEDSPSDLDLMGLAGLIHALTEACGRKVDVVPSDSVSRHIRGAVERDKVLIYER